MQFKIWYQNHGKNRWGTKIPQKQYKGYTSQKYKERLNVAIDKKDGCLKGVLDAGNAVSGSINISHNSSASEFVTVVHVSNGK